MRLNIGGHGWFKYDGYGRLVSAFVKAMLYAGHDVYPFELRGLNEKESWFLQAQGLDFSHATLQFAPPFEFQHLPGRSAAFSMHESMTLPEGWAHHINSKNQICIVPSPWLIEVFEDAGVKLPIRVVPGGIDADECRIVHHHRNGPFTFICLGDRGGRKGHNEVYQAFYKAFNVNNRDVRLIIKCRPDSLANLDFSYSNDPRLTVWRADVEHVADVFAVADACINPAKCEGFGMFPREAAACGLPTLVTRWSGTADDTDQWAVPLEDYTLVESHMKSCGGLWAQPSIDELVWRMRDMVEKRDEYKARALTAAQWMRDNMTYTHAAQKLSSVLSWWLGGPVSERLPEPVNIPLAIESNKTALAQLRQVIKPTNGHVTKKELAQP